MKKAAIFASVFIMALGLTIGIMVSQAEAGPGNCKTVCVYELVCSTDTGPYCPNPAFPYYMYEMNPYCLGYPALFCPEDVNPPPVGCCSPC